MRLFAVLSAALLGGAAATSLEGNLNYHSPSRRHTRLGINTALVSCRSWKRDSRSYEPSELDFIHGITSGDPYPNSVILWTRVAPTAESDRSNVTVEGVVDLYSHETEAYVKTDPNPICVEWKVYDVDGDVPSDTIVSEGKVYTSS